MFDFNNYQGKYVMLCETWDEDLEFRTLMDENHMSWKDGSSYLELSYWRECEPDGLCYFFNRSTYAVKDGFNNSKYALDHVVLRWSDFSQQLETNPEELLEFLGL